jgi:hypothetical protein
MRAFRHMTGPSYVCEFTSTLRRVPGSGGWVFAAVPEEHAPTVAMAWGRTPVRAAVDGRTWDTSVWRTKEGETDLAVPKKIRGTKDHGDAVQVRLEYSVSYRR